MRARAFDGLQKILAATAVPDAVKQAYQASIIAITTELQQSPYFVSMAAADLTAQSAALQTALNSQLDSAVKTILQQTRLSVLKALVAPSGTSFYFLQSATTPAESVDYQKDLTGLLLSAAEKSTSLSADERTAATTSLMTFKTELFGDPAIATLTQELTAERAAATTSDDRDAAQALLTIVSPTAVASAADSHWGCPTWVALSRLWSATTKSGWMSKNSWFFEAKQLGREQNAWDFTQEHRNSICFGVYLNGEQIGFARVVSDGCTFAYLCDVFVDENFRGVGVSKHLMSEIMKHPELQSYRRFTLATQNAHGLYAKFGFQNVPPDRFMEIRNDNV
jgi:GNAT superfamily N-acetyltransferase